MYQTEDKIYEFGSFRLDLQSRRLYQGEDLILLRPKAFDLLQLLVERAGILVERELIQERIWPNQIVEEGNLTQHIYQLRKALSDSQKNPEYILTFPGKGYLFNQKVQLRGEGSPASHPSNDILAGETEATDWVESGEADNRHISGGRRISPRLLVALVLIPLALLGIAMAFFLRGRSVSTTESQPKIVSLVTFPGEESDVSFSPDGQYVAFSAVGETQSNRDIYVKSLDSSELWRVTTHPGKDTQPAWSPDGKQIAFLRNADQFGEPYTLVIVPVRGGEEKEIGQVTGGLSWSPDGKFLSVSASQGIGRPLSLYLFSSDGRERKLMITAPLDVYDTLQKFSPDGTRIAFVRWKSTGNADLFVYRISDQQLVQLTHDETPIHDLQWNADSTKLYFISRRTGSNRLWSMPVDGGDVVQMTNVPQSVKSFSISPAGNQLVFTQPISDTQIDIFERTRGERAAPLKSCSVNSSRADDTPRFSPDGTLLAFVSDRSGYDEIWIANRDCTNARQVTNFKQNFVGSPRWSPDGEWLVFDRNVKDNSYIFKIRINGTDLLQLTSDPSAESMPSWSRDGEWIYFSSNKTSIPQIYRVPARGGEVMAVTLSQGQDSIESEDGASLYFINGAQLWRKDLRRGDESAIPELASVQIGRYWDLSGTTLFFVPQKLEERLVVKTFDLETRATGQLVELPGNLARWVPGVSVVRGGDQFAIAYVSNAFGDIHLVKEWN